MSIIDETYCPIDTAPRDGTPVIVADEDAGSFLMSWNAECENGLFPDVKGFWEAPDKSMTWGEHDGYGPTYWKPYNKQGVN